MKSLLWISSLLLTFILTGIGQAQTVTINTPTPKIWGQNTIISADGAGASKRLSYGFAVYCPNAAPPPTRIVRHRPPEEATFPYNCERVGTFRARAEIFDAAGNELDEDEADFEVLPPNKIVPELTVRTGPVTVGTTHVNAFFDADYLVKRDITNVGIHARGWASERIGNPDPNGVINWSPWSEKDTTGRFVFHAPRINDRKGFTVSNALWNSKPDGAFLYSTHQQVRIWYKDCDGTDLHFDSLVYKVTFTKVNDTTVQITHEVLVPQP